MKGILSLCALLALATPVPGFGPDEEEAMRRADVLLDAHRRGSKRRDEDLTRRLVAIGPDAVPHLCGLLRARSREFPTRPVALALGQLGTGDAVGSLRELLSSREDREREAAVLALGSTRSELALDSLVGALEDEAARVRLSAPPSIATLARSVGTEDLVDELVDRLQATEHPDAYALTLAALDGLLAREALYELLEEATEPRIVLAALSGLWGTPRKEDGEVVHALLLDCREAAVCKKACLLLGRLEYSPATPDLIDLLYERDEGMVKDAHWALMQITGLRMRADPDLWESWWERRDSGPAR